MHIQCREFFKRAHFYKKTGEKRAPFQQKKGQKTGEIRHFQQKNGRFQAFLLTNFLNNL